MKTEIITVRLDSVDAAKLKKLIIAANRQVGWLRANKSDILRFGLRLLSELSDESFRNVVYNYGYPTMEHLEFRKQEPLETVNE